jgi:hypothetical protein
MHCDALCVHCVCTVMHCVCTVMRGSSRAPTTSPTPPAACLHGSPRAPPDITSTLRNHHQPPLPIVARPDGTTSASVSPPLLVVPARRVRPRHRRRRRRRALSTSTWLVTTMRIRAAFVSVSSVRRRLVTSPSVRSRLSRLPSLVWLQPPPRITSPFSPSPELHAERAVQQASASHTVATGTPRVGPDL